jgi:hypothetical protein
MKIKMNKWNPYTISLTFLASFISVGLGVYLIVNNKKVEDTEDTEDTGNTFDEGSADKNRQHESYTPQGPSSNTMPTVTKVSSRKQPPIGVGGGGFRKKTNKKHKKSKKSRRNININRKI